MNLNWYLSNIFMHNRIHTTKSAECYSCQFPTSFAEGIGGGVACRDKDGNLFQTPPIEILQLLRQLADVEKCFIEKDIRGEKGSIRLSVSQQYRIGGFRDMVVNPQIWHATAVDYGQKVSGLNVFTNQKSIVIPDPTLLYEGPNNPDLLGCYVSDSGNIFIFVDKIAKYGGLSPLIYQKVLLHEFVHFLLDVASRDKEKETKADENIFDEETIDNMLVLFAYDYSLALNGEDNKVSDIIKTFISSQPRVYSRAIDVYENYVDNWMAAKKGIYNLLKNKIQ